jgi:hypothetical protein
MESDRPKGEGAKTLSSRQMIWISLGLLLLSLLLIAASVTFAANSLVHELLHEPGFALLVALATWWGFEIWRRIEDEKQWAQRVELIQNNVFLGVLGKDIPAPVLAEANRLILHAPFVRDDMDVVWTLTDHEIAAAGKRHSCVLIHARVQYRAMNVSVKQEDYPLFLVLPNPRQPHFKPECELVSIGYEDSDGEFHDLTANVERHYCAAAQNCDVSYCRIVADYVGLSPKETIEIVANYKMVKEPEDFEFQQTMMPATSLKVTVVDRTRDPHRRVFGRAIHSKEVRSTTLAGDDRTYVFELQGSALPHQGIMISWDSSAAAQAPLFSAPAGKGEASLIAILLPEERVDGEPARTADEE